MDLSFFSLSIDDLIQPHGFNSVIKLATPKLYFLSGPIQGTQICLFNCLLDQFVWMSNKSLNVVETKLLIFLRVAVTSAFCKLQKDLSLDRFCLCRVHSFGFFFLQLPLSCSSTCPPWVLIPGDNSSILPVVAVQYFAIILDFFLFPNHVQLPTWSCWIY